MHSIDRHWRTVRGSAMLAVVVPVAGWLIAATLASGLVYGRASISIAALFQSLDISDVIGYLSFVAMASALFALSDTGRRREQVREKALKGDKAVPAPSIVSSRSRDAVPLEREPLAVLFGTSRRPPGVIASTRGLTWRRAHWPDVAIPWTDMRLLEVTESRFGSSQLVGYCVYGSGKAFIEWQDFTQTKMPRLSAGMTREQMLLRQRQVLATVIARTGRTPRTQVPELIDHELADAKILDMVNPSATVETRRMVNGNVLLVATVGLLMLSAAVLTFTLPLSQNPWINLAAALPVATIGTTLFALIAWWFTSRPSDTVPVPLPLVALPPVLPSATASLSVRERWGWKGRMQATLIGVILAAECYPVSLIGPRVPGSSAPLTLRAAQMWVVSGAYMMTAIVGLGIACIALFGRRSIVTADEIGLRWERGKKRITLPWETMSTLVAYVSNGRVTFFGVVSNDANLTEISWPSDVIWFGDGGGLPPTDAAAQLAALVAARTGLSLVVMEGKPMG